MKKLILLLIASTLFYAAPAQVIKRLADRAKQAAERNAGNKVERAVNDAMDGKSNSKPSTAENRETTSTTSEESGTKAKPATSLKAYSKFDFVPGDKILYAEDFSQDVVGEFPLKWNTNGSGELMTIEGVPGKWLQLNEGTKYESPFSQTLPENFTVEFDLLADYKENQAVPYIYFKIFREVANRTSPGAWISMGPQRGTYASENTRDNAGFDSYDAEGKQFLHASVQYHGEFHANNKKNTPVHVAVWVQKQRVRVWMNSKKIYDLPKALPAGLTLDKIGLELPGYGGARDNYQYYLSNLKVAVATPDNRNKLITEGKWSTTGILFDVNSDIIKPSSYGTLKEIATVLNENPDVKVKIIGHTDSDGADNANLELSKKRSAAVKAALASEFKVGEDRMVTDGLGETKPVGDNKTPEGKAQNRRVEFIKM